MKNILLCGFNTYQNIEPTKLAKKKSHQSNSKSSKFCLNFYLEKNKVRYRYNKILLLNMMPGISVLSIWPKCDPKFPHFLDFTYIKLLRTFIVVTKILH